MKDTRWLKKMSALALAMAVGMSTVRAASEMIDGALWSYTVSNKVATITSGPKSGDLNIPSFLGGYPVKRIKSRAFYNCKDIATISIPNGITNIESEAFSYCKRIMWLTIPTSVSFIGERAFCGCQNLRSLTISGRSTDIEFYAFACCDSLYSATIGNESNIGEININSAAFFSCTNLTSLTIGNNVRNIPSSTFLHCEQIKTLIIGNSVTNIGGAAFKKCYYLPSLTIPDSVKSIGAYAFGECSSVRFVSTGNGVTSMDNVPVATVTTNFIIGNSVTNIGEAAFYGRTNLVLLTIGNSVQNIGDEAFYNCSGLNTLFIPASVTNIGSGAFSQCSGLKTLQMPSFWKTKSIGGRFWSMYTGVPYGCTISYYEAPFPEGEKTSTPVAVPYGWLEREANELLTANGGDHEATARSMAANGQEVWKCYATGLSPTNPTAKFMAEIDFSTGTPLVKWNPDLNESGAKTNRSYEVEGKTSMSDDWGPTNASSHFFRVKVSMP